jgi:alpha-glucosidase (family GH31 glycosyl hydrolase)
MVKQTTFLLLFVLVTIFSPSCRGENRNPIARKGAMVVVGNARFTILTPEMIRMEWDSTGQFTDQATLFVINRNLPVPEFTKKESRNSITIKTNRLVLKYKKRTGQFTSENLEITYSNGKGKSIWRPGMNNKENLKGTYRTLDGCKGKYNVDTGKAIPIEDGLLSKEGWTVIDDSDNFLFDNSDWNWVEPRRHKEQDLYFIQYGRDYKKALHEFTEISGKVPIPPIYAFGYWWSRYWNYSDDEIRKLVWNFHYFHIPLDVLVIDMDWHKTKGLDHKDEFGQRVGWTGYTWERSLFPEPVKFLEWLNEQDLKVTLNLHPASGIPSDEKQYPAFAKAMNFDTTARKSIPFEAASKKYMTNLFNIVLHPLEKEGVSFWWLDWQQWPYSKKYPGLSNTWWLNYVFFSDMQREEGRRPLIFHRWGGLGNHRYEIGFSGDVVISWESLNYQPYFTATASNVLYGYWSHDLGGHFFKGLPLDQQKINPELYIRWMQFGAFSPIFRTHSSKDARIKKEVWNFPYRYSCILTDVINLRYTLVPYIYTMAREDYDTGISLCRPMYYDYPEKEEAYSFKNEYMFGDNFLIQPITSPAQNDFSTVRVWLPEGNDWYEWNTGTMLKGGQTVKRKFLLNEYPVYVKAGSIIPMYPKVDNLEVSIKGLVISVFPGKRNTEAILYEDAGNDLGYKKGECSFTTMKKKSLPDGGVKVTVMPRTGSFPGMTKIRNYEIRFIGSIMPDTVWVNGSETVHSSDKKSNTWWYTGNDLTAHISVPNFACNRKLEVIIKYPRQADNLNGVVGKMNRLKHSVRYLKNHWNRGDALPGVISLTNQTDRLIDYHPRAFAHWIKSFNINYQMIPDTIRGTPVDQETIERCIHYIR